MLICVQLYPPDSIRWILWITHKYSATAGCRDFPHYASRGKAITGTVLKFAGYIHHYIILPESIFGLIWKNKMATTGVSLSVMKQCVEIFPLPPLEQKVY